MSALGELLAEHGGRTERAGRDERDVAAVEAIMRRGGRRLERRMARVEAHLERVTTEVGAPLAAYATATILAGGKRLRPLLVLLAAEALGGGGEPGAPEANGRTASLAAAEQEPGEGALGEGDPDDALVRAAAAVELMHSATLVHDDVIDGAQLRRGHPTVAVMAGRRAATATGDLLFSRAFAELARNGDLAQLRALSDASSALAAGELIQREDAFATSVSVARYLARCEMKTAALFEAACRLGALAGSPRACSRTLVDALGAFARRIGLAFQVLDDVLDISGPVADTGKSRGTDLLDGTITLPLILAREADPALARVDLRGLSPGEELEALCERIAATGALEDARALALQRVREAKERLPAALVPERAALLELLADAVVERYR
jgi:geranylgeranyl pyrophosphate synthase